MPATTTITNTSTLASIIGMVQITGTTATPDITDTIITGTDGDTDIAGTEAILITDTVSGLASDTDSAMDWVLGGWGYIAVMAPVIMADITVAIMADTDRDITAGMVSTIMVTG